MLFASPSYLLPPTAYCRGVRGAIPLPFPRARTSYERVLYESPSQLTYPLVLPSFLVLVLYESTRGRPLFSSLVPRTRWYCTRVRGATRKCSLRERSFSNSIFFQMKMYSNVSHNLKCLEADCRGSHDVLLWYVTYKFLQIESKFDITNLLDFLDQVHNPDLGIRSEFHAIKNYIYVYTC